MRAIPPEDLPPVMLPLFSEVSADSKCSRAGTLQPSRAGTLQVLRRDNNFEMEEGEGTEGVVGSQREGKEGMGVDLLGMTPNSGDRVDVARVPLLEKKVSGRLSLLRGH